MSDTPKTDAIPATADLQKNPPNLPKGVSNTQVRFLTPDMCRIHLGNLGALHVTVLNEGIYGGVYAAYAFPVAHPNGYVSLLYTAGEKDFEIGVIRNLDEFPAAAVDLIRKALRRRYFVHVIKRIPKIGWKYGLISMEVETDKGTVNFFMRWSYDRAVDYGQRGKVLIDMDNNRYLIPDVETLDEDERAEFQRYIYW
jgi:hypothetical protein